MFVYVLRASLCVCVCVVVEADGNTDDLTLCSCCQKLMKTPVWLPCLDAFCLTCVDGMASCPKCGEAFEMSSEGVSKYRNTFLTRVVDEKRVSSATGGKDECDLCKFLPSNDNKCLADYYCMDCHLSLCSLRNASVDINILPLQCSRPA